MNKNFASNCHTHTHTRTNLKRKKYIHFFLSKTKQRIKITDQTCFNRCTHMYVTKAQYNTSCGQPNSIRFDMNSWSFFSRLPLNAMLSALFPFYGCLPSMRFVSGAWIYRRTHKTRSVIFCFFFVFKCDVRKCHYTYNFDRKQNAFRIDRNWIVVNNSILNATRIICWNIHTLLPYLYIYI